MVYQIKAKSLITSLSALLLLWGIGGCAVMHDMGFRPGDPSLVIPHHTYMPRGAEVCSMAPAYYGYHATCWSPWPGGWEGCPPLTSVEGTDAEMIEGVQPEVPTLAPGDSALEYPEPPQPSREGWGLLPMPQDEVVVGDDPAESLPGDEVAPLPVSDEPESPPAPPTGGNPFHDEESPTAKDRIAPVPETSRETPPSEKGQLTESPPERDAPDVSVATWLVSATEDPAGPYESDWLLSVDEDDAVEPAPDSNGHGASQDGRLPSSPDARSTSDLEHQESGTSEAAKVSLAYPRSSLLTFP